MTDTSDNIVPLTPKALSAMEEFLAEHERELLTILFTDLVDSTQLQSDQGNAEAGRLVQIHRRIVREELQKHGAREVEWAGDSCLAVFSMPSDGVRFALTMQAAMRKAREGEPNLPRVRVGLHLGEIFVHKHNDGGKNTEDLFGLQVSEAARVMSLARGDQIYMSRPVYDNARSAMKGQAVEGVGEVAWHNHGPFVLKGSDEPIEVCEVGEVGHADFAPPEANDKCWHASASREVEMVKATVVPSGSDGQRRSVLRLVLASLLLGALVSGAAVRMLARPEPPAPDPVHRFTIVPDIDKATPIGIAGVLAISPDGTQIVFVAGESEDTSRLYLRSMDGYETRVLEGTEGASAPFFSPDGAWVGFFSRGDLKKVSVNGGSAQTLSSASRTPRGATWGPDDTIIFSPSASGGLFRIPATGGEPQRLTEIGDVGGNEMDHRWPSLLPGGDALLFTIKRDQNLDEGDIVLHSLDSGEYHVLLSGGSNPRYVDSGHVVFGYNGTLMAFPFDQETLQQTGPPVPVLRELSTNFSSGSASYAVSLNGILVYRSGGSAGIERGLLQWIDEEGKTDPLDLPAAEYLAPRPSPDGTRVALGIVSEETGYVDIWIYHLTLETLTRLTFEGNNNYPVWMPDSREILFSSTREGGGYNLYRKPADGSAPAERLSTFDGLQIAYDVSRDGALLTYSRIDQLGSISLWALPLEGDRRPRPFLETEFNDVSPAISPDGRWMAYYSDEQERNEIYVRPFPGPGGKWQVSRDGGKDPIWSRDGTRIFYRNGSKIMGVSTSTGDTFSAGTPEVQFEDEFHVGTGRHWGVSADGSRFLVMAQPESSAGTVSRSGFRVVTNWFSELERLAPTGK